MDTNKKYLCNRSYYPEAICIGPIRMRTIACFIICLFCVLVAFCKEYTDIKYFTLLNTNDNSFYVTIIKLCTKMRL